jgi:hypothetical protein
MAGFGIILVLERRWSFWGAVGVFSELSVKSANHLSARHSGFPVFAPA